MNIRVYYNAPTEDAFAAAFSELVENENNPDPTPSAGDPALPAGAPPAASADNPPSSAQGNPTPSAAGGDTPTGAETPELIPDPSADDAGADPSPDPKAEPEPDPKEDDDAVLARLAALVNKAAPPQPQAPAPPPQPREQPPVVAPFTPEEQQFLDTYEKDWTDVSKAEALKRRAEYTLLTNHIFNEVTKVVIPLLENVRELATRSHLSELETSIPDYGTVRDKVVAWVETQPSILRSAYNRVIQEGTVDEIKELVSHWKAATGGPAPASAAPKKQGTELPSATKKAADELAPVGSKRSPVAQTLDNEDFGSAFRHFASKAMN